MVKDAYRFALPPLIAGALCFLPGWKTLGVVLVFSASSFFISFAIRSA